MYIWKYTKYNMFLTLITKVLPVGNSSRNLILIVSFAIFFIISRQMPEEHLNKAVSVSCEILFTSSFASHYAIHAIQS